MNCLADIHSFQPEDVVLHAAPLTHGSGMYLLPALARGSRNLVLTGSFDPARLFSVVREERVTVIAFIAPTQVVAMIDHPAAAAADMSSLKAVVYGGGPMYVRHIRRALELWGPIWVQLYGQGETPMTGTYLRQLDHVGSGEEQARRLGSIGIPRTDVELRVFDSEDRPLPPGEVGELVVRGPTVMRGYWGNPGATAEALRGGWLHTGDVGYADPDGYLHLVDRAKDMIVSGGNNVYAREVEEALLAHPAVSEVAVIGVPDSYWGEAVHAIVVAGAPVTAEDLVAHCRERLAAYKRPRSVAFVESLPKNAYGKVLKRELRQEHWGGGAADRLIAGGETSETTVRELTNKEK
jgi:acyl-CoA synthetase (AMP-forming)/AMP-acid ligase II